MDAYTINAPSDASSIWPREEAPLPTGGAGGRGTSVDPMHRKMDEERGVHAPVVVPSSPVSWTEYKPKDKIKLKSKRARQRGLDKLKDR